MKTAFLATAATALTTVALGCSGPIGRAPETPLPTLGPAPKTIPPEDERVLEEAMQLKQAGDAAGAFRMVEKLPPDSAARLDRRYEAISNAWSDERSRQIGRQVVGGAAGPTAIGGGPPATSGEQAAKVTLDAATFERTVEDHRPGLRNRCFPPTATKTSFTLGILIGSDGRVADVYIDDVNGERGVAVCVREQARKLTFPGTQQGGEFTTHMYFDQR